MGIKTVLLYSNQFSERAESSQFIALAQELDFQWNVHSIIAFPRDNPANSPRRIVEAKRLGLDLLAYSSPQQLRASAKREEVALSLVMSDGSAGGPAYCRDQPEDFRLGDSIHAVHAVFRNYYPHGDYYLYVSDWLLSWARANRPRALRQFNSHDVLVSSLPHGLAPPDKPSRDFRRELGIPEGSFVLARLGGFDSFNDDAASQAVLQLLREYEELHFVAVNTRPFGTHPRLHYVDFVDRTEISGFYYSFDLFLNGQQLGETFGLSITEPMAHGKPVLAPHWLRNRRMNRHGILLLRGLRLLYRDQKDLELKVGAFIRGRRINPELLKRRVRPFSSATVAKSLLSLIGEPELERVRKAIVRRGFWAPSAI